jgi:hypothetical protein
MKIIDNFLSQEYWQHLHDVITSPNFAWYCSNHTSAYKNDNEPQMVHVYYRDKKVNSELYSMIQPMLGEFEKQTGHTIKDIHRIKSNLLFNRVISDEAAKKTIHQDSPYSDHVSLLYYLVDSDGDTILYEDDEKTEKMRIEPKANRAVIFDSNTWHTGLLPVKNKTRYVINFTLKVK